MAKSPTNVRDLMLGTLVLIAENPHFSLADVRKMAEQAKSAALKAIVTGEPPAPPPPPVETAETGLTRRIADLILENMPGYYVEEATKTAEVLVACGLPLRTPGTVEVCERHTYAACADRPDTGVPLENCPFKHDCPRKRAAGGDA